MHDLLLYDFNLYYNLIKKNHYLNVQWLIKNLLDNFRYFKNSDIKISEITKNIKESIDSLLRNYWNKTKYMTKQ